MRHYFQKLSLFCLYAAALTASGTIAAQKAEEKITTLSEEAVQQRLSQLRVQKKLAESNAYRLQMRDPVESRFYHERAQRAGLEIERLEAELKNEAP